MPKGKRGSHGAPDPLQFRLFFEAADDRFKTRRDFEAAVEKARAVFLKTGMESPGVHVVVRWRNPESESDYSRQWKSSDDSDQTLEGAYGAYDSIIKKVR